MTLRAMPPWRTLLLVLALGLVGALDASAATGILEVHLHDHREAIGDFQEVLLTITSLAIHPRGQVRGMGWISLPVDIGLVDLTKHTPANPIRIFRGEVAVGIYDAVRMDVTTIRARVKNGREIPVLLPAGAVAVQGIVRETGTTIVTFDLTLIDMTDHPGKGYELHVKEARVTQSD